MARFRLDDGATTRRARARRRRPATVGRDDDDDDDDDARRRTTTTTTTTRGDDDDDAMTPTPTDEKVPTVSLELYATDFKKFVHDLGEAYERYGFVILENHGIDLELIERAMARSKAFFACDEGCKKKYTLRGAGRRARIHGVRSGDGEGRDRAWYARCDAMR
jgi:hypothetical protein